MIACMTASAVMMFKFELFPINKDCENQPSDKRVDKLLCPWLYENGDDRDKRTFKDKASGYHLEAMESTEETSMGITEVRREQRPRTTYIILRRPISMGCHENMRSQSNLQRGTRQGWSHKLS